MKINLKNSRYMQYLAAITATLSALANGMNSSWTSPVVSKLKSDDSPIGTKLNDEEISWVVSSSLLATAAGSLVSKWCVDYLGRKNSLLYSNVVILAHWLCLIFANSLAVLIIGRVIGGAAIGVALPAVIIYTAEVSEEDIRGKLGTYNMFLKTLGTVIVLVVGPYVSYTTLGIVCASTSVIFYVSFFSMPESPFFYVKIGKREEARKSLIRLSRKTADDKFINKRLEFIQNTVEEDMKNNGNFIELLTKKQYRWSLFLLFGIKSLQQLSGNLALEAYIQPIIEAASSGLDPEVASIIIGCIQIPAVFLTSILIDRVGRKPLLISSAILCGVALFGEGTYFLIQDYLKQDTSAIGWLPTAGLALFWIMNPIGVLTVPYILLGELFPTNIKGAAVGLGTVYGASVGFLVSKFFQPLSNAIGIYTVFYIFTGICFAGSLFVFFLLPETKGKNFQEIQELLKQRKKSRNNVSA